MNIALTQQQQRFTAIDVLRGAVMLIMALGHVRHLLHLPALTDEPTNLATTTPLLFFTRWISHYCAATFIFLAGISIHIIGQGKTKREQGEFLITRGLWLVVVELLIVSFSLTFQPSYPMFVLQVIWATGWSMVLLGLLIRTSYKVILIIGCMLFFGHNILDYFPLAQENLLLKFLFTTHTDAFIVSNRSVLLVYAVLPWTGTMLLGYAFGAVYKKDVDPLRRRKILVSAGIAFILLFFLLRFINLYGDPSPWSQQKNGLFTVMSFLNVTKYPVSLQYGCMTLGPVLLLLAALENKKGWVADRLAVFGRVAFFYYVLHFFLIHVITGVLFFATGHTWHEAITASSPFLFRPYDFGFDLAVVYAIWVFVILLLYLPCKWFGQFKRMHKGQWWLRYV
ncbi:DUF1624 domain-containing protein [Chitinophaga sp. SYP-B3965]|uniref:DUF1624 domain-containing protein n=1 Tax=Chitinophaga sp. SYP-B3965 TaxID=2663120 RepID=UPI00129952DA|nr:heparan-alpha-glucosaminide N-acetyltransferase domain-containing protein [Chitinophaga sp. SYP-B3965]MRG48785.1 DUF1624 domain-containing protein [Chitinophaga sp. SYP-B3965]